MLITMPTLNTWPSKDGLRLGHMNINHAFNKLADIQLILENSGNFFHVFCFSESHIPEEVLDADIHIPGYKPLRRHPEAILETGLLLYYNPALTLNRKTSLEQFHVESLWVEIKIKHSAPFLIGFIYRNPAERIDWLDRFSSMMDAAMLENKDIFLFGDFNINLLKPQPQWTQTYTSFNLNQLIDHYCSPSSSL